MSYKFQYKKCLMLNNVILSTDNFVTFNEHKIASQFQQDNFVNVFKNRFV